MDPPVTVGTIALLRSRALTTTKLADSCDLQALEKKPLSGLKSGILFIREAIMAYYRTAKVNGRCYYYLVESYREGGKVRQRILEYYGKNPPLEVLNNLRSSRTRNVPDQVAAAPQTPQTPQPETAVRPRNRGFGLGMFRRLFAAFAR